MCFFFQQLACLQYFDADAELLDLSYHKHASTPHPPPNPPFWIFARYENKAIHLFSYIINPEERSVCFRADTTSVMSGHASRVPHKQLHCSQAVSSQQSDSAPSNQISTDLTAPSRGGHGIQSVLATESSPPLESEGRASTNVPVGHGTSLGSTFSKCHCIDSENCHCDLVRDMAAWDEDVAVVLRRPRRTFVDKRTCVVHRNTAVVEPRIGQRVEMPSLACTSDDDAKRHTQGIDSTVEVPPWPIRQSILIAPSETPAARYQQEMIEAAQLQSEVRTFLIAAPCLPSSCCTCANRVARLYSYPTSSRRNHVHKHS